MRLVSAVLAIAVIAPAVRATPLDLPRTKATIDVPASWSPLPPDPSLVVAYRSPSGLVLAVTRAPVPNPSAWIPKSRAAYAAEIQRGAVTALPGLRTLRSKLGTVHGIPTLDLELRRADGATLVIRILLYRTYALATTIEVPAGGALSEARAIIGGFAQPAS